MRKSFGIFYRGGSMIELVEIWGGHTVATVVLLYVAILAVLQGLVWVLEPLKAQSTPVRE